MAGPTRDRSGFTLIELLVTLAVFSLALTVLLSGLRSGVRAYNAVLGHQKARALEAQALGSIRSDLRHLARVSQNVAPLVETSSNESGDLLRFTAFVPQANQRAGAGGVWQLIEYRVGETETGEKGLLRSVVTHLSEQVELAGQARPQLLVAGASRVEFSYLSSGSESKEWSETSSLPAAIVVTVSRDKAPALGLTAWVSGAMEARP